MSAKLEKPNGSHWLATEYERGGAISKEELYPVVILTLPRVGEVRAKFSADRYRFSDGSWSDWRIYARDFEPAHGVGEATRRTINQEGEPLIREWLASDEYRASRQNVAGHMMRRIIIGADCHGLDNARDELRRHQHELTEETAARFTQALDLLNQAVALLES